MKVHPIIMSPPQLMEALEHRRFFLPLRIEIAIPDRVLLFDQANVYERLAEYRTGLSRLNYDCSHYRNEAAREEVYTATQRNPISYLLAATREFMVERPYSSLHRLYLDMGLAEEEAEIAHSIIYNHVRDEQRMGRSIGFSEHHLPESWRIPRYEWCRADARPPRTSPSVQEWANATLVQPFVAAADREQRLRAARSTAERGEILTREQLQLILEVTQERARRQRPFRVTHRDDSDALAATQYQMAALQTAAHSIGTSASNAGTAIERLAATTSTSVQPSNNLRLFIDEIVGQTQIGIPASMLETLRNTSLPQAPRETGATPPPPPPPAQPALLLQARHRRLTLPAP